MNNRNITNPPYILIMTTYSDEKIGKRIIDELLNKRLVACIQSFPINSSYVWKGKISNSDEVMLFIKTKADFFEKVKEVISKLHDYETPEIISIPITDGSKEYLNWIDLVTK